MAHVPQADSRDALLRAATTFGQQLHWDGFLRALYDGAAVLPGLGRIAVALPERRSDTWVVSGGAPEASSFGWDARPFAREGASYSASALGDTIRFEEEDLRTFNLSDSRAGEVGARFASLDLARLVCLPLLDGAQQLAGILYAAFDASASLGNDDRNHLLDLGAIATPTLLNLRTRERLAKGDKRRASLIELSHAINTSLELDTVLDSARAAIRNLEGHTSSAIALIDKEDSGRLTLHWDRQAGEAGESPDAEVWRLADTPFHRVLETQDTFESGDLKDEQPHPLDKRLAELGVRRYTIAPMFARGRVIGGFLLGTSEPHPALTTDVWLYENIAMQLALAIDNARQFARLEALTRQIAAQNVYLREEIAAEHNVEGIVGRSPALRRMLRQVVQVAKTDTTVLILGETGTGKELVARAIHAQSDRAEQPLVKVNCAAIPENLVESELFGHEKGAFTSATARRFGRFELAKEGTIFLDEVGELPLAIQAKLLRVLQDGEFERVGGAQTLITEARVIAATNRDLAAAIERGGFRADLYYRLNVFPVFVPSLADRREDIPLLVDAFIAQFNRRMGKQIEAVDRDSLDHLERRAWPGNIRELRHVIERAMILSTGSSLVVEEGVAAGSTRDSAAEPSIASESSAPFRTLEAIERDYIRRVVASCDGRIEGPEGAALILGLNPSTLRSRMKRLGLRRS